MPKKPTSKTTLASAPAPTSDSAEPGTVRQRHKKASHVPSSKTNVSAESASTSHSEEKDELAGRHQQPHIPGSVVRKLVTFSLLLLIAPIFVYFTSLKYVFVGSTAASAITAVVAANMVLVAWVYAAWTEDG